MRLIPDNLKYGQLIPPALHSCRNKFHGHNNEVFRSEVLYMEDIQDVPETLSRFAEDVASVVPSVDAETEGQYGSGLGSELEERQVNLILDALAEEDDSYQATKREVGYPNQAATCDILLNGQIPVEAKLLRYWRANGDPEHFW